MHIVNLTPHEVVVELEGGRVGFAAPRRVEAYFVDGIPISRNTFGNVIGLPEPEPDTLYIVSLPVLQALVGKRYDIASPDTTPGMVVRDTEGKIVGVRGFQII